jgi:DNA repair exonuclease SbcCD ATPase subunit
MSPLGRVFIVLNLILAGTFVGFSGTYLQKQDTWKDKYTAKDKDLAKLKSETDSQIAELTGKVTQGDFQKAQQDRQIANLKNDNDRLTEENKRLNAQLSSIEADVKALNGSAAAMKSELAAAFGQAKEAYAKALSAEKDKDEAVAAKDAAVAAQKDLEQQVAGLTDSGTNKDATIASLSKDKSELTLLVDVAKAKGFLESMAVPAFKGTVTQVSNNKLVTISVTENPESAEVKVGYRFAIYDAKGYKGEARVTAADNEKKVAFCTLDIVKGAVNVGDSASTQTN